MRMLAEWESTRAIWVSWPHNRDTWPGRFDAIPRFYATWVAQICDFLPVRILVSDSCNRQKIESILRCSQVELIEIPTNDCWIRDYGPTTLWDSGPVYIDWAYNAWGGKYPPWNEDNAATAEIIKAVGETPSVSDLCLEGGALETDGYNRLLVNPHCIATHTRNPGRNWNQIACELRQILGVSELITIPNGIVGDDTDGHIDQLARFIDAKNIVVSVCDDKNDENHEPLEENYRCLQRWAQHTPDQPRIHRLPIPRARSIDGQRLPESYCNFLRLGPHAIQLPTFGDTRADTHAKELIASLSKVPVIEVDCQEMIWGLGALHCASWNELQPHDA